MSLDGGSSLRRLVDVLDYLVDERVGIIESVDEVLPSPGVPNFFQYGAKAANTQAFSRLNNFNVTGGASTDRDLAMAKAVGEAIERYCSAIYDVEAFPLTSSSSATMNCVSPSNFALYRAEQFLQPDFPWDIFDEASLIRWVPAYEPVTGELWHVPAAMVFVPYHYYQGTGEAAIVQPISTGLACHCSQEEAAYSAICEVVERDAFTITWQARLSMPHIRLETLSDTNHELVQRFERTGASVTLLNITLDAGVPTILAVLQGRPPDAAALVFAAAADLNAEVAVRKSLEELEHTRRYSQLIKAHVPRLVVEAGHANIAEQKDHLNFWCDHANRPSADFIFASEERIAFDQITSWATGNPRQDVRILIDHIHQVGHRVLLVDVTTPDVQELGLAVMRALVPGFHPLFMGFQTRALGGYRLWEVPQKLGHVGIALESGDNPLPHPYP